MNVHRERYAELSRDKPEPYCFEIKMGKQSLFYFGANHSRDPKNHQYPILRNYWKRFLEESGEPRVAFVEGRLRPLEKTQRAAIIAGSEGSVLTLLATKAGIPLICPEPADGAIDTALWKTFSPDEILYYDFSHYIDAWRRFNPRPDFTSWMKHRMQREARKEGWHDFTLPKMKALHRKLFGIPFSLKDLNFFNHLSNPNRSDTIVNQVARFSSDMRDSEILKRILKEWKAGNNIFIAYGSGHAYLHEPILKRLLK